MNNKRPIKRKTKRPVKATKTPLDRCYETHWRNKYITADATSIGQMIKGLREAAKVLLAMKRAGVVLDKDSDMAGDFARLITTESVVAKRFGLDEDICEEE